MAVDTPPAVEPPREDARPLGMPRRISSLTQQVSVFATKHGGQRPLHAILVANNGIAAVKFITSIRKWAYALFGSEKAVCLVAMATQDDIKSNAEHVHMADQFVEVPGGSSAHNYGNVDLIVQTAVRAAVDAVWPGWGHASEKPELPRALSEAGIVFLGPHHDAMAALGDKVASSILAQSAGVPTLPWSGSNVRLAARGQCSIPDAVYSQACVHSLEETIWSCNEIGYPVMIKASWGGGGKGIRKVLNDEDVALVYKQVLGEVPGSPVFTMKLAPQSRHFEVQLLCDAHGQVVSLYSRDCSVQRRHQKIVEEGPVSVAPREMLLEMEACARSLAAAVGYVGAATVEFLYVISERQYYFLELNPRLQVEHPVTEWISGVNIPASQVMIGMGIPLHLMPEIRALFGRDPAGQSSIAFDREKQVAPTGHVVAVRITSEHAEDGFTPTCGTIDELHFRSTPDVWGYFSVKAGSCIHEFSDSQFGHVFAKGADRPAAIKAMVVALKEVRIRGEVRTLVDYAVEMLQQDDFVGNRIHTGWLDARIAAQVRLERPPWHLCVIAGAVLFTYEQLNSNAAEYLSHLSKGQIPPLSVSLTSSDVELNLDGVKYFVVVARTAPDAFRIHLNGSSVDIASKQRSDGGLLIQVDGRAHLVHCEREAAGVRLVIDNLTCLLANEHDPSILSSTSPGKLVRYLVPDGAHLEKDRPYAEMEVMKQIMLLIAPAAGHVHFHVAEGCVVAAGDLLATLDLDDANESKSSEPFSGTFPELAPPQVESMQAPHKHKQALHAVDMLLAGYQQDADQTLSNLLAVLALDDLPRAVWQEEWTSLAPHLPEPIAMAVAATTAQRSDGVPARDILDKLLQAISDAPVKDQMKLETQLSGAIALLRTLGRHGEGLARHAALTVLDKFLTTEQPFLDDDAASDAEVVDTLRRAHSGDLQHVVDLVVSHQALPRKARLVEGLLDAVVATAPTEFRQQLTALAAVTPPSRAAAADALVPLVRRAQALLERALISELTGVIAAAFRSHDVVAAAAGDSVTSQPHGCASTASSSRAGSLSGSGGVTRTLRKTVDSIADALAGGSSPEQRMAVLIDTKAAVEEAIAPLLASDDLELQRAASTAFVCRLYSPFLLAPPEWVKQRSTEYLSWDFEIGISVGQAASSARSGRLLVLSALADFGSGLAAMSGMSEAILHIVLTPACLNDPTASCRSVSLSRNLSQNISAATSTLAPACSVLELEVMDLVADHTDALARADVSQLSFIYIGHEGDVTRIGLQQDTESGYQRSEALTLLDPPTALMLETSAVGGFDTHIARHAHQLHTFVHEEKTSGTSGSLRRAFVRTLARRLQAPSASIALRSPGDSGPLAEAAAVAIGAADSVLGPCLRELERLRTHSRGDADWAHIFVHVLPSFLSMPSDTSDEQVAAALQGAAVGAVAARGSELRRAAVAELCLRLRSMRSDGSALGWRVVVSLPTGHETGEDTVSVYKEVHAATDTDSGDCSTPRALLRDALPRRPSTAALNGSDPLLPYPRLAPLQQRRLRARRHNTTYCYDFLAAFEAALRALWAEYRECGGSPQATGELRGPEGSLLEAQELVMAGDYNYRSSNAALELVTRDIGENDVGIVAWRMLLRTPESPQGRLAVAVANDITFQAGAFGPREDAMFRAICDYVVAHGLPLLYLAANSGARVGLDQALKHCLHVKWARSAEPWKGFEYLYLTDADHQAFVDRCGRDNLPFVAERVEADSQSASGTSSGPALPTHWRLTDVIGVEDGLGVECLSGSASIASAFSKVFDETFTITFVSGRTVGIGAYLSRLGRRVVQRADQPVILTGFQALNKLLGRAVYTSQLQLGGPRVMGRNGVTHLVVHDDLEGVAAVLRWLTYVKPVRNAVQDAQVSPAATLARITRPGGDTAPRPVTYAPPPSRKFNVRDAIAGCADGADGWLDGLFDRGSWFECHRSWAGTVVTGRARLSGLPVGVLGVETETVMLSLPADPGLPESTEQLIPQAGQVWYPDSAQKTAEAIEEFDREGLPLFVLANWRGFSGGQRDLFEGVLQAGSRIVEALRRFRHPAYVYVPPGCELRGGAWVVIDSQINPDMIEMYSDPTACGSVLEAEGIVEIKYRKRDLLTTMGRLDPALIQLNQQLEAADAEARRGLQAAITARQEQLLPIYHSVALQYAVMHETPVRMVQKGVIQATVPWVEARNFFIARVRRRTLEEAVVAQLMCTASNSGCLGRHEALCLIRGAQVRSQGCPEDATLSGPNQGCSYTQLLSRDNDFLAWASTETGRTEMETRVREAQVAAAETYLKQVITESGGRAQLLEALQHIAASDGTFRSDLSNLLRGT